MEKIKGQLESYKRTAIFSGAAVSDVDCHISYRGDHSLYRRLYPHSWNTDLSPEMFAWEYNTENVSMMPAIINTVLMVLLVLLIAVPVGIGAAIYLVEYAKRGSKLVKLVRITAETLSGIPSTSMVCSVICYLQQHSDGVIPSWEVRSLWRL